MQILKANAIIFVRHDVKARVLIPRQHISVPVSTPYHLMDPTDLTSVQRRYPGLWRPNEYNDP